MVNPKVVSLTSTHSSGRFGSPILLIVVHATAGTDSRDWLVRNERGVSAHSLIMKDGTLYRMVPDSRAAHHAGFSVWVDPKTRKIYNADPKNPNGSVNLISIGIEIENLNNGKDPYPDEQLRTLGWELRRLRRAYPTATLVFHRDIDTQGKTDPRGLDWPTIQQWVAYWDTPVVEPKPTPVTTVTQVIGTSPSASLAHVHRSAERGQAPLSAVEVERIYTMSTWLDIDPVFVFAMWAIEGGLPYGTSPVQQMSRNPLNIRAPLGDWRPTVLHNQRLFYQYESFQLGLMAGLLHLKNMYGAKGLVTIESIAPTFAPSSDGNDPLRYAARIRETMAYIAKN